MTLTEVVRLLEADKVACNERIAMYHAEPSNEATWGAVMLLWGIGIQTDRVLYWLHLYTTSGEVTGGKV